MELFNQSIRYKALKMKIGQELQTLRRNKHLTTKEVSEATYLPAPLIELMEEGSHIDLDKCSILANFYGKRLKMTFEDL